MFERNPVKTEKGIFRRDVSGHWWELVAKPFAPKSLSKADGRVSPVAEAMNKLEGAVIIENDDNHGVTLKGWKKVSAPCRIEEIEKSVNMGRIVLEIDFI